MRVPCASHLGQAFDLSDALLKAGLWDEINDVLQASGLACGSSVRQDPSTSSGLEEQVQSTVDFESLEELEGSVTMRRASIFCVGSSRRCLTTAQAGSWTWATPPTR